MNLKDLTPLQAARYSLKRILQMIGDAGVIILDRKGRFVLVHTPQLMASGYAVKQGTVIGESVRRIRLPRA